MTFEEWWDTHNPTPPGLVDDMGTGRIAQAFKQVAQKAWDAAYTEGYNDGADDEKWMEV